MTLMIKIIYGIAQHYLSDRIDIHFAIHSYGTSEGMSPDCTHSDTYNFFLYLGGKHWNDLPDFMDNSTNTETFKRIYKV